MINKPDFVDITRDLADHTLLDKMDESTLKTTIEYSGGTSSQELPRYTCGHCKKAVKNGVYCLKCSQWYHRHCTKISRSEFNKRLKDGDISIICKSCKSLDIDNTEVLTFPCGKCCEPTENTDSIGCDVKWILFSSKMDLIRTVTVSELHTWNVSW